MKYFSQAYLDFFAELRNHNSKEWFDENRPRYEKYVKKPMKQFASDLLIRIREIDDQVDLQPKEVMGRINRDIRFSKDKTPYNTYMSMNITRGGKKSGNAGFYFALSDRALYLGGGAWSMPKESITKVKEEIIHDPKAFISVARSKSFIQKYGGLAGESFKRIPKAYQGIHEEVPEIALKSFYFMSQDFDSVNKALEDGFIDYVLKEFAKAKPLNDFLNHALA